MVTSRPKTRFVVILRVFDGRADFPREATLAHVTCFVVANHGRGPIARPHLAVIFLYSAFKLLPPGLGARVIIGMPRFALSRTSGIWGPNVGPWSRIRLSAPSVSLAADGRANLREIKTRAQTPLVPRPGKGPAPLAPVPLWGGRP
jgi:hypothetical protein